jgi:hypothetical protein
MKHPHDPFQLLKTGQRMCYCAFGCGEYFKSLSAFLEHRVNSNCLVASELQEKVTSVGIGSSPCLKIVLEASAFRLGREISPEAPGGVVRRDPKLTH